MKPSKPLIALAAFFLPILATTLWFYSGLPKIDRTALPDFSAIDLPRPPLSTLVALPDAPKSTSSSVLIDLKHGNLISLSEIDPLLRNIEALGGAVDVFKDEGDLSARLKSAASFLIPAPMSTFTADELLAVTNFVERGGRLVVITDPTRNTFFSESGILGISGVDTANLLLEPFDVSFKDDYLYNLVNNEGNYRNIIVTDIADSPLMKDIGKLVIYGGHSLNSNGTPLVTTDDETKSSADDRSGSLNVMETIAFGKGQVLAIGDISLLTTQYVQTADNQIFVRNLAKFLTEEVRQKTLVEFPFLFKGDVVIQPTGNMKVDGELLSAISNLEKSLAVKPGSVSITQEPKTNSDRIVLTTFVSNKDTQTILESLEIDLASKPITYEETSEPEISTPQPETTPTATLPPEGLEMGETIVHEAISDESPQEIFVPGIGKVKTSGLGIIGLVHEKDRTTLLIMASSPEKIQELLIQLATENLTNCLVQDDAAACRISGSDIEPGG